MNEFYQCLEDGYVIANKGEVIRFTESRAFNEEGDEIPAVDLDYVRKSKEFKKVDGWIDKTQEEDKIKEDDQPTLGLEEEPQPKEKKDIYCLVKTIPQTFSSEEEAIAAAAERGESCVLIKMLKKITIKKEVVLETI